MNCFFIPAAIENPESRVSEMLEIIPQSKYFKDNNIKALQKPETHT